MREVPTDSAPSAPIMRIARDEPEDEPHEETNKTEDPELLLEPINTDTTPLASKGD